MLASHGDLPSGDGWTFEPKWDGMRVLAEVDHGVVRLRSRTNRDVTVEFPELAVLADVAPTVILDGEVVAFDPSGRPSFSHLQPRFGVVDPSEARRRAASTPITYVVFDLLHLDGIDVWQLPFEHRRRLLETLEPHSSCVTVTPSHVGDGPHWLQAARERGMEGVVAKRLDHAYEPGRRSASWRKIKIRHEQEFAVCGWIEGTGARRAMVGSLVLGCFDGSAWRWVGNAGSGLADADLRWWTDTLIDAEQPAPPFSEPTKHASLRAARWVVPDHVVQVAFAEWTPDGRLRQPSILGRRLDVSARDVRCVAEPSATT